MTPAGIEPATFRFVATQISAGENSKHFGHCGVAGDSNNVTVTQYNDLFLSAHVISRVRRWRSWLWHCATSRKVAGSIPDDVIGIFHWHNPSGGTMALGLTQPLTEMSTRNISWRVKAAGAWGWQPYHLHVPNVLRSGSLNLLEPSRPVQACNGIALPHTIPSIQPNPATCVRTSS